MFTHKLESAHNLWFRLYCQMWGFEVTGSHLNSGSILKIVLDKDIVTTKQATDMKWYIAYLKAAIVMILVYILQGHLLIGIFSNRMFRSCKISTDKHVVQPLCNSRDSCCTWHWKCEKNSVQNNIVIKLLFSYAYFTLNSWLIVIVDFILNSEKCYNMTVVVSRVMSPVAHYLSEKCLLKLM